MLNKVQRISRNPIEAAQMEEREELAFEEVEKDLKKDKSKKKEE
jgi:hypothetical protein